MLGDTIQAVASAPGASRRGVLRVSGPEAFAAIERLGGCRLGRARGGSEVEFGILGQRVAALVLTMPAPHSYTGEDVVELHLPGSPLLLRWVGSLLAPAVRPARPGEFTRRAFESGRLGLAQAEAVGMLIAAASAAEARCAMALLRGGLDTGVTALRARLLDVRAWIEAGLDFEAAETGAVDDAHWIRQLDDSLAEADALERELPRARPGGDVVLIGRANAGKSSLANALSGHEAVLVTPHPGTTRDVIAVALPDGTRILDAPGELDATDADPLDRAALAQRDRLLDLADAALLVVDPRVDDPLPDPRGLPVVGVVATRADLGVDLTSLRGAVGDLPLFAVGCPTGLGIDPLRAFLGGLPHGPDSRPSHARESLASVRAALDRAAAAGREGAPEIAAVEVGLALELLAEVDGQGVGDAVLDRIFGQFCLGK